MWVVVEKTDDRYRAILRRHIVEPGIDNSLNEKYETVWPGTKTRNACVYDTQAGAVIDKPQAIIDVEVEENKRKILRNKIGLLADKILDGEITSIADIKTWLQGEYNKI